MHKIAKLAVMINRSGCVDDAMAADHRIRLNNTPRKYHGSKPKPDRFVDNRRWMHHCCPSQRRITVCHLFS